MKSTTAGETGGMRTRLRQCIEERYGEITPKALRELAAAARVNYTTLARYLRYPTERSVQAPRARTLNQICLALDIRPEWLREGQGTQQLAFWPILLPSDAETEIPEPAELVRRALDNLRNLPPAVQRRACREAVSAMINTVASEGVMMPTEGYMCLMHLDALQRKRQSRAAG